MDSRKAQELFQRYAPCMAYIAVTDANGMESIGSAFHVGEGVFVTARHVVENVKINEVKASHMFRRPLKEVIPEYSDDTIAVIEKTIGKAPTWPVWQVPSRIIKGPCFHSDAAIDVAVFATEGLHPETPYVPLGSHLDDWIGMTDFVLSEVLVLGYPPIPLTREATLVVARSEINAIITTPPNSKVQFVVSATPRGGFSGGLVLSEYNFALGVISASLTKNHEAAELGFMAVISIEAIYECLAAHKLLPEVQKRGWNDFWNTDNWDYVIERGGGMAEIVADVSLYDDGKKVYIGLYCREHVAMSAGLPAILRAADGKQKDVSSSDEMHTRIMFEGDHDQAVAIARRAVAAACVSMEKLGYKPGRRHPGAAATI
jgi:hypothetical protein